MHAHSVTISNLLKSYKQLLKKLQSSYLDDPAFAVHHTHLQLASGLNPSSNLHQSQLDLKRPFDKLYQMLVESDLRALYLASKQKAKERLQRALGRVTTYTNDGGLSASPAPQAQSPFLPQELQSLYGNDGLLRRAVIYVIGNASRLFMQQLNKTQIEGLEIMEQAMARPAQQPLITVSNHVAAMDDPLIVSTLLPPHYLSDPKSIRWTLCATDRCFKSAALTPFFRAAKVLPVQRGGGLQQPGMLAAEERLRAGDWVHIFPEGTRSKDGTLGSIRKGVGKLVAACDMPPLIVPFVHHGMTEVMRKGKAVPSIGKEVKVLVGEPIPVSDLMWKAQTDGWTEDKLCTAIAQRVSRHLNVLHAKVRGEPVDTTLLTDATPSPAVSGLDLFDHADVVPKRRLWERVQFKQQHREWLQQCQQLGAGVLQEYGRYSMAAFQGVRQQWHILKQYASSSLVLDRPPSGRSQTASMDTRFGRHSCGSTFDTNTDQQPGAGPSDCSSTATQPLLPPALFASNTSVALPALFAAVRSGNVAAVYDRSCTTGFSGPHRSLGKRSAYDEVKVLACYM